MRPFALSSGRGRRGRARRAARATRREADRRRDDADRPDEGRRRVAAGADRHQPAAARRDRAARRRDAAHRRARAQQRRRRRSDRRGATSRSSRKRCSPARRAQLRNMATVGGNLLQRTRCAYFRDPHSRCNKRAPGERLRRACDGVQPRRTRSSGRAITASRRTRATWPSRSPRSTRRIVVAGAGGEARCRRWPSSTRCPARHPERETALEPGELIVGVELAPAPLYARSALPQAARPRVVRVRAGRRSAAALDIVDAARFARARIALGGVATIPWRARAAERALIGRRADARSFARRSRRRARRCAAAPPQRLQGRARASARSSARCARSRRPTDERRRSSARRIVGTGIDRVDGPLKVTGAARYAADAPVPEPLYAVLVQSTIARGRIRAIRRRAPRVRSRAWSRS